MDITAETLEEVPEAVGGALWKRLTTAHLDSFQLFLAFSTTYPSIIKRRYDTIPRPDLPLASYLAGITSHNQQWLTQLTLLDITIPRTALIQLSSIPNLCVLTIGPGVLATDIGVDDSLLRTWSRAASIGAFSMLRVLALRDQVHVTTRAFSYFNEFPALSIVTIDSMFASELKHGIGLQVEATALVRGWRSMTSHDLNDWLVAGDGSGDYYVTWDTIIQAFFNLGGHFQTQKTGPAQDVAKALDALPTVHLAIGGYPDYAYICDDSTAELMPVWHRNSKEAVAAAAAAAATISAKPVQLPLPDWSSISTSNKIFTSSVSTKVGPHQSRTGDSLTSTSTSTSTSTPTPMPSTQLIPQKRPQDQDQDRVQDQNRVQNQNHQDNLTNGPPPPPKRETKNRAIRPSKHQNMNDVLLDFST